MLKWLTGKKTYLGAAALAAITIASFWFGALDASQLGEALAIALAIVGLGHKFDRQKDALVEALEKAKATRKVRRSPEGGGE